ncbi:hypothetical protein HN014_04215 [Aquimarina sp. TRL1]|uniref:hypothetical protein n=1 Tax=Aquimarina sp. (strain TRL1) TaxID=2736252 RepID=UPI00158C68D8|nr:hypothetical protein [Aquimarina sp. TRL1]QKX04143.1 hypothetical protein HN014_04215 [Aquimarina sp. TRL1]
MKISKGDRTKVLAQNSIDYIVLSNPGPIRKIIFDCGYEVPKDLRTLVQATKELIQKKGKTIISEILRHHPDKKAILSLEKKEKKKPCNSCNNDNYNNDDNFCGACGHSNYNGSGDEDSFLDQFSDASDKEVKNYYDRIVKRSNANPEDQKLASEVQMVWNEIRQRKLTEKDKEISPTVLVPQKVSEFGKDELVLLSVVFIAGYLVGATRMSKS